MSADIDPTHFGREKCDVLPIIARVWALPLWKRNRLRAVVLTIRSCCSRGRRAARSRDVSARVRAEFGRCSREVAARYALGGAASIVAKDQEPDLFAGAVEAVRRGSGRG